MTVSKGTAWGHPMALPADAVVHGSDGSLFNSVNALRTAGAPLGAVGLTGGTLWSMLGGASCVGRLTTSESRGFPCDLGRVETDCGVFWFASSLVAHSRTWSRVLLAMNAQNVGPYRFGHRAHPGDGLLDVYEAELPLQQRFLVAKRAKLGAHLPHPGIRERRVASADIVVERPLGFRLDSQTVGRSRVFRLRVEPDALTVVL